MEIDTSFLAVANACEVTDTSFNDVTDACEDSISAHSLDVPVEPPASLPECCHGINDMYKWKVFYVVRKGHKPGIYSTWLECKLHSDGFIGAQFRKFGHEDGRTLNDALDYLNCKGAGAQ